VLQQPQVDGYVQARLHVADEEAAAGLQSLAHLMARVQRAAAHAHRQGDDRLQTLRSHESDVSTAGFIAAPLPPSRCTIHPTPAPHAVLHTPSPCCIYPPPAARLFCTKILSAYLLLGICMYEVYRSLSTFCGHDQVPVTYLPDLGLLLLLCTSHRDKMKA